MLGTLSGWYAWAKLTADGDTMDAAIAQRLVSADAAIKKLCHPYQFETVTETEYLNAPWNSPWLVLPLVPVRSITSIHYNPDGFGISANYTSDHLLTAPAAAVTNPDYILEVDMYPQGWSKSGRVRRLNRAYWGVQQVRPFSRLGFGAEVESRSIKVVYEAGHTIIPADVIEATYIMIALMYGRRANGAPIVSESWNGASRSYAGPLTSTAALNHPDVQQLLAPYVSHVRVGS